VLSNLSRRDNYDKLFNKFRAEDAYKTFEKFYDEFGFQKDQERDLVTKLYPNRKRSYYEILGVAKNASLSDIQKAYRNLAIKCHPKNCSDKDA